MEGNRNVSRETDHYNLDAIISVGYRVNSMRATQFRRWATQVLGKYTLEGYVLDHKRMENGSFLDEDYFEKLLEEIREIRLSERRFYQKITDIYATSLDYDKDSPLTRQFFAKVQNKMHYAVSHQTAAEGRAKRHIPMTMQDWAERIDKFLLSDDRDILKNAGKISMEIAKV